MVGFPTEPLDHGQTLRPFTRKKGKSTLITMVFSWYMLSAFKLYYKLETCFISCSFMHSCLLYAWNVLIVVINLL